MDWKAHPSIMYIHILFWRIYFYKSDFSFSFYAYFFFMKISPDFFLYNIFFYWIWNQKICYVTRMRMSFNHIPLLMLHILSFWLEEWRLDDYSSVILIIWMSVCRPISRSAHYSHMTIVLLLFVEPVSKKKKIFHLTFFSPFLFRPIILQGLRDIQLSLRLLD